jgi:phosphoribosylanthranilate isomerase
MPSEPRYVKICGITRLEDAMLCVEAGASAIGLNFVPESKRRVDETVARAIVDAVKGKIETVGVVADLPATEMHRLREEIGLDWLQLHGDEPETALTEMLPRAFKAVRIGDAEEARLAEAIPGDRLLADAKAAGGELGGTGAKLDWFLVRRLAEDRVLILAGGLTPENVAQAISLVRPWGVDVASGVESAPGVKDPDRVRTFIGAARGGVAR